MPYQHLYARAESPRLDLVVDMGNPILNSTVNGFLKVGPVGATHAASQEAFNGASSPGSTQVWSTAFIACGGGGTGRTQPWGGALTGAILTLGDKHFDKQKMIQTAITGGAIATANELLRYL